MQRDAALTILRKHAGELRALGVRSVSLFGSTARDEATGASDVDVAVELTPGPRGFPHIARMEDLRERLAHLLGADVDVIEEPVARERLRSAIARDRARVF